MLYYSNEARQSHIDEINKVIKTISEIPGGDLDFLTASSAVRYLQAYRDLIEQELESKQSIHKLKNNINKFNFTNKHGINVKSMLSNNTYLVDVVCGDDIVEVEAKIISLRIHNDNCFADIKILKQNNYNDKWILIPDSKYNEPMTVHVEDVKSVLEDK